MEWGGKASRSCHILGFFARGLLPTLAVLLTVQCMSLARLHPTKSGVSMPGGAGHALLFNDTPLMIEKFDAMPSDQLTFEAWISTSDECNKAGIMSYAVDPGDATSNEDLNRAFNAFVVFNQQQVLACRDFAFLQLAPDDQCVSCACAFDKSDPRNYTTASVVDRAGGWKHLAVTWNANRNGLTSIYVDGLLIAAVETGKTTPLPPGGALVLGAEQDCFGGCTEERQAFRGMMDEVRLWKRERTHQEIMRDMRREVDPDGDLVAYWKFNDLDEDKSTFVEHEVTKDASGNGHDLVLIRRPPLESVTVPSGSDKRAIGSADFDNSYAINTNVHGMPTGDMTIEFWGRFDEPVDPPAGSQMPKPNAESTLLSYAAMIPVSSTDPLRGWMPDGYFADDAIRVDRYLHEYKGSGKLRHADDVSTAGTLRVHLNANAESNAQKQDNWVDFDTQWVDSDWHHVAIVWSKATGKLSLFKDGVRHTPFWASINGRLTDKSPKDGGVAPTVCQGSSRQSGGSLVLGQNQECLGSCFETQTALDGQLAQVRIWGRALNESQVIDVMNKAWKDLTPDQQREVSASYEFSASAGDNITRDDSRNANHLYLGSPSPSWQYSTAPLVDSTGQPLPGPTPGAAGHALRLGPDNVLMVSEFRNFPGTALTLEFWMMSEDACNLGTVFSYATGDDYGVNDNSFDVFNYQSWGVAVMEDEGTLLDHMAGVGATDGEWHHIAVTWDSSTGRVNLYDNGRLMWKVKRGQGKTIPSGGTLVVGREQDCRGGCFDSRGEGRGSTDNGDNEWGSQDFYGLIEEMRLWDRVLSQDEILDNIKDDEARSGVKQFKRPGKRPNAKGLVSYWRFDEGEGFRVKDEAGPNDLVMSGEPHWVVVPWLAMCGDGWVQGLEECDDGNARDGDGCSHNCQIEDGFVCTGRRHSYCYRKGSGDTDPEDHSSVFPWDRKGKRKGRGDDGHSGSEEQSYWASILAVLAAAAGTAGALFAVARIRPWQRYRGGGGWASSWRRSQHNGLEPLSNGDFVHASDLPTSSNPYERLRGDPDSTSGRLYKSLLQGMPGSNIFYGAGPRLQGAPPAPAAPQGNGTGEDESQQGLLGAADLHSSEMPALSGQSNGTPP